MGLMAKLAPTTRSIHVTRARGLRPARPADYRPPVQVAPRRTFNRILGASAVLALGNACGFHVDPASSGKDAFVDATPDTLGHVDTAPSPLDVSPDPVPTEPALPLHDNPLVDNDKFVSLGHAPCLDKRFLAGFALTGGKLVSTSTSKGQLGTHHVFFSDLGPAKVTLSGKVPFSYALGAPLVDPLDPNTIVFRHHGIVGNKWGWTMLNRNGGQPEPRNLGTIKVAGEEVPATYINGMAYSKDGLLAVGASNFIGGQYYTGKVNIYAWDGEGNEIVESHSTFGKNANGLDFVTIGGKQYLMVINTGSISQEGVSQGPGALTLLPVFRPEEPAKTFPLPGGLNVNYNIAKATTLLGTKLAFPSATNDGKTSVFHLSDLPSENGATLSFRDVIEFPNLAPNTLSLMTAPAFSPDARYLMIANQDAGRAHVYDLKTRKFVSGDGYQLDTKLDDNVSPDARGQISKLDWAKDGVYATVAREYLRIPNRT